MSKPSYEFYKNNPDDTVWWVDDPEVKGVLRFSFDRKRVYNLFQDYPHNLTKEQKEAFDLENPYWRDFFATT